MRSYDVGREVQGMKVEEGLGVGKFIICMAATAAETVKLGEDLTPPPLVPPVLPVCCTSSEDRVVSDRILTQVAALNFFGKAPS